MRGRGACISFSFDVEQRREACFYEGLRTIDGRFKLAEKMENPSMSGYPQLHPSMMLSQDLDL